MGVFGAMSRLFGSSDSEDCVICSCLDMQGSLFPGGNYCLGPAARKVSSRLQMAAAGGALFCYLASSSSDFQRPTGA